MLGKLPHQVQWHEGMLLRPQHFQQSELRLYESMYFYARSCRSFYWGFVDLELDKSALSDGVLRVLSFEAIMPDGTFVQYNHKSDKKLEIKINIASGEQEDIYLCLPAVDIESGVANQNEEYPRYLSVSKLGIKDQNIGERVYDTPSLVPNLRLLRKSEVSNKHVSIRIAKVANGDSGFIKIDYSPACLFVEVDSSLGKRCLGLVEKIRSKINYLLNRTLGTRSGVVSKDYVNVVNLMSFALVEFEAMLRSNRAHPFDLYLCLCRMAGFIRGIDGRVTPPIFDVYDHGDIDESFNQVLLFISGIVDAIDDNYWIINFVKLAEGRVFSLQLQADWELGEKLIIGLRSCRGVSFVEFSRWVQNAIIATSDKEDGVREKRILGAVRRVIDHSKELKLVPPDGVVLLEVEVDSDFITPGRELRISNPDGALSCCPEEVLLYLRKDEGV